MIISGKMEKLCKKKKALLQHTIWFSSEHYLKGPNHTNMMKYSLVLRYKCVAERISKGCSIRKYSATRIRSQQKMLQLDELEHSGVSPLLRNMRVNTRRKNYK